MGWGASVGRTIGAEARGASALAVRSGELFSGASPRRGSCWKEESCAEARVAHAVGQRQFLDAGGAGDPGPFRLQHADIGADIADLVIDLAELHPRDPGLLGDMIEPQD